MNVPVADVDIAGQEVSAAIDTGARICFAHARLLAQAPRIGEQEDFYPGCGRFTTGLHQSELQMGAYAVSAEVAALPDPLDSQLSTFGIEAIVGNNILLKDRIRIDYARRAIGFAWNINPVHQGTGRLSPDLPMTPDDPSLEPVPQADPPLPHSGMAHS